MFFSGGSEVAVAVQKDLSTKLQHLRWTREAACNGIGRFRVIVAMSVVAECRMLSLDVKL